MKTALLSLFLFMLPLSLLADAALDFKYRGLKLGMTKDEVLASDPAVNLVVNPDQSMNGVETCTWSASEQVPSRMVLIFMDGTLVEMTGVYSSSDIRKIGGSTALIESLSDKLNASKPTIYKKPDMNMTTGVFASLGWDFPKVSRHFMVTTTIMQNIMTTRLIVIDTSTSDEVQKRTKKKANNPGF